MILLTLLGCPFEEPFVCEYTAATLVDTVEVSLGGAVLSGALEFGTDEAPPGSAGLSLDYTLTNLGEADCAVAIYVSDTEPDPDAVPTIDAVENAPPESIPGVGTRLVRANLGPVGSAAASISAWAMPMSSDARAFVTVIACDGGQVETLLGFEAELCADPDEVNDEEGGYAVTRVW